MAYPWQPSASTNYVDIQMFTTAWTSISSYVNEIRASAGSVPDQYFAEAVPGTMTVSLYNCGALLTGGYVKPGTSVKLINAGTTSKVYFWGRIIDVEINAEFDKRTAQFVRNARFTVGDFGVTAAKTTSPAGTYAPLPSENAAASYFIATDNNGNALWDLATSLQTVDMNQFSREVNALELLNVVCRSIKGVSIRGNYPGFIAPIANTSTANYLFTDGTHTGTVPANILNYTEIEHGYSNVDVLEKITANNWGLAQAPNWTSPGQLSDIDVPYTAEQPTSLNIGNEAVFDTAYATDNLGWNLLHENGCGGGQPVTWGTTTTSTWKISKPSQTVMALNNHSVYRCKVIAAAGAAVGSGFLLDIPDPEYDFVTTFPGGATVNNWIASVKIRVTTQRTLRLNINWYDANGNSTGTTTGTNTVINTGSWTTLSTQCSTANVPANSVTAVPVIVTNVAIGQYGYFFASEAMLTRTNVATTFFDGETADDSSYIYTWTGAPYTSPAQKNTNTFASVLSGILTGSTAEEFTKSVTVNFQKYWSMMPTLVPDTTTTNVKVCVNNVIKSYSIVGFDIQINPDDAFITFHLARPFLG